MHSQPLSALLLGRQQMSDRFKEFLALVFVFTLPFFGIVYLFLLIEFTKFLIGGSE